MVIMQCDLSSSQDNLKDCGPKLESNLKVRQYPDPSLATPILELLALPLPPTHPLRIVMPPLQNTVEDANLEPSETTIDGTRPLGFRSIHGVLPTDNVSIFSHSTNSTASNLVCAGRILGSLYSSTGRRLEKSMGNIAYKAGLGPEAIYQRISALDVEDWKRDSEKG